MTEDEIEAGRTMRGGFTRAQLAEWGVPWPPPKGWKRKLLNGNQSQPEPEGTLDEAFRMIGEALEYAMFLEERIEALEKKLNDI